MKKLPILAAAAIALSACGPTMTEETLPVRGAGGAPCNADDVERFVGMEATQEVGAEIQAATGAELFRWASPTTALTMDYREDRVTVHYGSDNRIVRIACG